MTVKFLYCFVSPHPLCEINLRNSAMPSNLCPAEGCSFHVLFHVLFPRGCRRLGGASPSWGCGWQGPAERAGGEKPGSGHAMVPAPSPAVSPRTLKGQTEPDAAGAPWQVGPSLLRVWHSICQPCAPGGSFVPPRGLPAWGCTRKYHRHPTVIQEFFTSVNLGVYKQ